MYSTLVLAAFAALAAAKTDLTGCTTSDVSSPAGASVIWYVPGTGELCDPLDCGGGTAPPKTTVPGCPLYSGTATYSPSYISGFKATGSSGVSSTTYTAASTSSSPSTAMITSSSATDPSSSNSGATTISPSPSTSGSGFASSSNSTSSGSGGSSKSTSTGTAASSSSTGNIGVVISADALSQSIVGALVAGIAFLL